MTSNRQTPLEKYNIFHNNFLKGKLLKRRRLSVQPESNKEHELPRSLINP